MSFCTLWIINQSTVFINHNDLTIHYCLALAFAVPGFLVSAGLFSIPEIGSEQHGVWLVGFCWNWLTCYSFWHLNFNTRRNPGPKDVVWLGIQPLVSTTRQAQVAFFSSTLFQWPKCLNPFIAPGLQSSSSFRELKTGTPIWSFLLFWGVQSVINWHSVDIWYPTHLRSYPALLLIPMSLFYF